MKIHSGFEQNSLDWLIARAGVATASDFGSLITDGFKIRPWSTEMPNTFLAQKVAEAWLGGPLPDRTMTIDMEFGKILEEEAIPWYCFTFNEDIQRAAFITTDDWKIGCSPDGLIGDEGGVEIKCPSPKIHVKNLLSGEMPVEHGPQVYGSLFVTGRKWWKFISYCRNFPALVKTIEADEAKMEVIEAAVDEFLERFEAAMQRIENMAGKPRPLKRFSVTAATKPQQEPEMEEVIP